MSSSMWNLPHPDHNYCLRIHFYYLVIFHNKNNFLEVDLNVGYNWYERVGRGRVSDPAYSVSLVLGANSNAN